MKTTITTPAVLALALSVAACSKSDTAANTSVTNETVLTDEGGADVNLSDNTNLGSENTLDNAALDDGALDNGAGATTNGL